MSKQKQESPRWVALPIVFKEMGGTLYITYGYFSPEARETATEKINRLLLKDVEQKSPGKH